MEIYPNWKFSSLRWIYGFILTLLCLATSGRGQGYNQIWSPRPQLLPMGYRAYAPRLPDTPRFRRQSLQMMAPPPPAQFNRMPQQAQSRPTSPRNMQPQARDRMPGFNAPGSQRMNTPTSIPQMSRPQFQSQPQMQMAQKPQPQFQVRQQTQFQGSQQARPQFQQQRTQFAVPQQQRPQAQIPRQVSQAQFQTPQQQRFQFQTPKQRPVPSLQALSPAQLQTLQQRTISNPMQQQSGGTQQQQQRFQTQVPRQMNPSQAQSPATSQFQPQSPVRFQFQPQSPSQVPFQTQFQGQQRQPVMMFPNFNFPGNSGQQQMNSWQQQMNSGQQQMNPGQQMSTGQQQMSIGQQQMNTGQQQMNTGQQQMNTGQQQMNTGQQQMNFEEQQIPADDQTRQEQGQSTFQTFPMQPQDSFQPEFQDPSMAIMSPENEQQQTFPGEFNDGQDAFSTNGDPAVESISDENLDTPAVDSTSPGIPEEFAARDISPSLYAQDGSFGSQFPQMGQQMRRPQYSMQPEWSQPQFPTYQWPRGIPFPTQQQRPPPFYFQGRPMQPQFREFPRQILVPPPQSQFPGPSNVDAGKGLNPTEGGASGTAVNGTSGGTEGSSDDDDDVPVIIAEPDSNPGGQDDFVPRNIPAEDEGEGEDTEETTGISTEEVESEKETGDPPSSSHHMSPVTLLSAFVPLLISLRLLTNAGESH